MKKTNTNIFILNKINAQIISLANTCTHMYMCMCMCICVCICVHVYICTHCRQMSMVRHIMRAIPAHQTDSGAMAWDPIIFESISNFYDTNRAL